MSRSRNSYIRWPRSVTRQPISLPSRRRKPLTAILALVICGFWPVICASCSAACSMRFLSCSALPTPMLTTIFCSRGKLSGLVRPSFLPSAGRFLSCSGQSAGPWRLRPAGAAPLRRGSLIALRAHRPWPACPPWPFRLFLGRLFLAGSPLSFDISLYLSSRWPSATVQRIADPSVLARVTPSPSFCPSGPGTPRTSCSTAPCSPSARMRTPIRVGLFDDGR